jgi:rhodanese-related sulfurtransferase
MSAELKKNDPAEAKQFFADKLAFTTGPVELARNLKQEADIAVIDVRQADDYRKEHIPGSINLPHDQWSSLEGLRKDALNVLCCYTQQCHLAATAALEFAGKGYSVMELEGGFEAWKENDLEIERGTSQQTRQQEAAATA